MTNSDQTSVSVKPNDKKIHVPVTKSLAESLKENRGKVGLAAGVLATVGFLSAQKVVGQNLTADDANAEVIEASEKVMVSNEGSYLSIDPGDSILQSPEGASFSEAFKHAREELGPGGIFEWKGKHYNTFYAEEYSALTTDQKKDYAARVSEALKEENSSIIESKEGQLVEVEYNADNILSIKVIDQEVIDNMQGIQVDLTGDGEANISFQNSGKKEEENTEKVEEIAETATEVTSDENDIKIENGDESKAADELETKDEINEIKIESEEKVLKEVEDTEEDEVVMDFDDLPDSEEGHDVSYSETDIEDFEEYPDIDEWNEELL
ncbi:MAG: hypothetical protein EA409_13090 [Saprospirales bacterium]|nr:MAG: hypothetical protein EA409_13090 [Saprospirales bacterium]